MGLAEGPDAVLTEAREMLAEDARVNQGCATRAADLVVRLCPDRPLRILTHCNTGRLATTAFGTAIGALRVLHDRRTGHWFDMGVRPNIVVIRFFEEKDGWIGDFTDDRIGERFPTLDQLVAA